MSLSTVKNIFIHYCKHSLPSNYMNKEIRLLFVIGSFSLGGAEKHLVKLCNYLSSFSAFDVRIFSLTSGPILPSLSKEVTVYIAPQATLRRPTLRLKVLRHIAYLHSLISAINNCRPDVIHSYLPYSYLITKLALLISSANPIHVCARRSLNLYQQSNMAYKLEPLLHSTTDLFTCNSLAIKADLRGEGIPADKIKVIYNSIDTERFQPSPGILSSLNLLSVANFIDYKGHRDLIAAFAILRSELTSIKPTLLLVGQVRDIQFFSSLKQLAGILNVLDSIRFIVDCTDPLPYYHESVLYVSSSHEEGFSNSILEAMACGLPVVATDVGGNPEAVYHNYNGLIVPPSSPELLANSIKSLLTQPDLMNSMSVNARNLVLTRFSDTAVLPAYHGLYTTAYQKIKHKLA